MSSVFRFQYHKGAIISRQCSMATSGSSAFQYHKGAIISAAGLATLFPEPEFQYHKGAIISLRRMVSSLHLSSISIPQRCDYFPILLLLLSKASSHFNTTKVRLFLRTKLMLCMSSSHFNTTKVRLFPSASKSKISYS